MVGQNIIEQKKNIAFGEKRSTIPPSDKTIKPKHKSGIDKSHKTSLLLKEVIKIPPIPTSSININIGNNIIAIISANQLY